MADEAKPEEVKAEEISAEPAVKPGKKSSEHLMTYIAMAVSAVGAIVSEMALPEAHWVVKALIIIGPIVGSSVYTFGRSKVKQAEAVVKK